MCLATCLLIGCDSTAFDSVSSDSIGYASSGHNDSSAVDGPSFGDRFVLEGNHSPSIELSSVSALYVGGSTPEAGVDNLFLTTAVKQPSVFDVYSGILTRVGRGIFQ